MLTQNETEKHDIRIEESKEILALQTHVDEREREREREREPHLCHVLALQTHVDTETVFGL